MERVETKMERQLLEALRIRAAEEGRDEYEVIEDAARLSLGRRHPSITGLIERARERRPNLHDLYALCRQATTSMGY